MLGPLGCLTTVPIGNPSAVKVGAVVALGNAGGQDTITSTAGPCHGTEPDHHRQ
jgi:hypothetical protein